MGLIKNQYVFYYPYHEKEMVLEKDLAFQIHKVLRLKEGKKILLLDGKGKHSTYVLQKISPLKVEVSKVQEKFSPPSSPLILALALLKSDKTEWVLQKGTELGATQFLIFEGENSIAKIKGTEKKLVRWQKIIQEALAQSQIARQQILEIMEKTIPAPRENLSPYAPRIFMMQIKPEKIGEVIGTGGKIINEIIDACQVTIDIEDTGEIFITGENEESAKKAMTWISNIVKEPEIGEIYQGVVKRIMDFGAFIEILPGQEGLARISEISDHHINKVNDVLKINDIVPVKVISIDEQGRINLSLKQVKKK